MRVFVLLVFLFVGLVADSKDEFFTKYKTIEPVEFDMQKALLGKKIFFDTRLSDQEKLSCQSCHNLIFNKTTINPSLPTKALPVLNAAYKSKFFYDGSVRDINEQVKRSISSKDELNTTPENFVKKLSLYYKDDFNFIYKTNPTLKESVEVLVEFEKSLVSINSRFDEFLKGRGELLQKELNGFYKFLDLGCSACHVGINFGENLMESSLEGENIKVPSLRNVYQRGVYFKNFKEKSIQKAIWIMAEKKLGVALSQDDVLDIKEFLKTLDGEVVLIDE